MGVLTGATKLGRWIGLGFLATMVSGCSHVSYLIQAGWGQFSLYNHERPIDEVIKDPTTHADVRERLKWVGEIKAAVESELGVPPTSNYTTYVDLKRPYVVWTLVVAEPFELKLKEWSFPIVGAFPYLGFFSEAMAQEWAAKARAQGLDAYVRGATAYSTLGYLRDPLLSTMLTKNKSDMVNLVFHESTHGQIYLRGEGSFNEQVASFVGDYGERDWIERTYGANSAQLKSWENERSDRRRFGQLLKSFAEELKSFYSSSGPEGKNLSPEERSREKEERFAEFAKRLSAEPWKGQGYALAGKRLTNNAALLAVLTYEDDQYIFDLLEKKCHGSVKGALAYLKSFAKGWEGARQAAEKARPGTRITPQALLWEALNQDSSRCPP